MKTCKICTRTFRFGKNGHCSMKCYLNNLQFKLDECFRNDVNHTGFLTQMS